MRYLIPIQKLTVGTIHRVGALVRWRMPTTRETVLAALYARLQTLAALTLRDEVLPERIPAAGLIILRDGQPASRR